MDDPAVAVYRDERSMDSWTNERLEFRFCDPFKPGLQLECVMDLRVHMKPIVPSASVLHESDRNSLTSRIQSQFPDLHSLLYPDSTSLTNDDAEEPYADEPPTSPSISVRNIQVNRHTCSSKTIRQGETPVDGGYNDPWLVREGPLCRQLTQKLSRCMPRAMLDISTSRTEHGQLVMNAGDRADETTGQKVHGDELSTTSVKQDPLHTIHLSRDSPILKPKSHMGFCLGKGKPGQYCVPGTPEMAVLCPQGKVLSCPRPRWGDHASWTDLGSESERCVQMLGDIPGQGGNRPAAKVDALRATKIVDLFGNELSYGWWAKCEAVA